MFLAVLTELVEKTATGPVEVGAPEGERSG